MKKNLFYCLTLYLFFILPTGAAEVPSDEVVAKVNNATITWKVLESELHRLIPRTSFHRKVDEEKKDALRKEALDLLIEKELKVQEARRLGLKVKKKEIKKDLKEIIQRYPSRKAFEKRLSEGGYSVDDVREEIKDRLLAEQVYQREVTDKVRIDEAQATSYYESNHEKFRRPVQYRLKRILMKVPPLANETERIAIEEHAGVVKQKILEGLPFVQAVAEFSQGSEKDVQGDFGWVHKGRLAPEAQEAIQAAKPRDVVGPFKGFRGHTIFRLEEVRPERLLPFEEIREKLMVNLQREALEEREKIWIQELRDRAEIVLIIP